jgi:tRNA1(Val) A37 N6-methylase TrmN6
MVLGHTYRPPTVEKRLADRGDDPGAVSLFLSQNASEVRAPMLIDYRKTLRALCAMFPAKSVHEVTTDDLEALMRTLALETSPCSSSLPQAT